MATVTPERAVTEFDIKDEWYTEVEKIVNRLAHRSDEFTADDVWAALDEDLQGLVDPRALGPILRRAAKQKIIKATRRYQPSVRRHGSPVKVWKSLVRKS